MYIISVQYAYEGAHLRVPEASVPACGQGSKRRCSVPHSVCRRSVVGTRTAGLAWSVGTNSSPDITQTPSGNAPLPAWTSKPYGGRMRGLVQPDRAAAGQTNRGFDSPRRFVNRRASDFFGRQRLDQGLQIVAHQVKLRAQHRMRRVAFRGVAIFGMHSGFRWRQLEDEPAMPGIHRAKLQHIPAECPIRFRIVAIEKNMSTRDHGTTLPLGADDEQVPTPENRRRRPALHSANVSGAQCRGVSFALEAADPLLPTLGPFPLLRMSRMGVSRSCGLLPDMP